MTASQFDEEVLFNAARQIGDRAARAQYLRQAAGGDEGLLRRVEALLAVHDAPDRLLDRPVAVGGVTDADDPARGDETASVLPHEGLGTVIGPYKLLQQIGEGGMGTVFMAEQNEPVKRRVALKVIKPGMDSRPVVARFEAERQALAMMDHVNIARVFDGGTTQHGRPYFVMELVHGVPITRYCDDNHLTPRQRLELFVPVCQAIQHAHQKGIIHRDIKPSNVMVTLYDGKPVPKVIDFGVAKATEQKLTEQTLFTQYGTLVGTLEYMSPEQAELSALGVDTRSDIYSLGVLLYELLTGSTPLTHQRMKEAAYAEILRLIKEEEPPRPSTRLSDSGEALASISANRHTEPAKLTRMVRGELDWIVMKSLEKDRNRRYVTANGFAMDVQRYLADEAVLACPPSAWYRLRKFGRRNKGPVLATSLLGFALVSGVIGTTWGMLRATAAEAEAVREAGEKTVALGEKEAALATAKANESKAKAAQKDAQENLKDALAAVDQLTRLAEERLSYLPQMEPIRRDLLLDALKFHQKFLDKQSDDPVICREAAFAHRRVGRIHHQLEQNEEAEKAYRNAFATFDKLGPSATADPALLIEMTLCHIEFSWPLNHLGKVEESRQNIRRAVEVADKLDKRVPGNLKYILNARNNLASLLLSEDPHMAEKILKENLALADDTFNLEAVHRGLRTVYVFAGRLSEAEESAREALKYSEQLAAALPAENWVQAALANNQRALASIITKERPKEAQELQGRAVTILEKLATDFPMGPTYRKTLAEALIEDAGLLKQLGQTAGAEKAYRRAIDVYEKLATDFPTMPAFWQSTFDQRIVLGQFLVGTGKIEEASRLYRDTGATVSKLAIDSPTRIGHWLELSRAHCALARMLSQASKKQEAEAAFREIVALSEKLEADFGGKPEHRGDLAHSHTIAAGGLAEARHHADADRLFGWALQHRLALAREGPQAKQCQEDLAFLHLALGAHHLWRTRRLKDANQSYQAACDIFATLARNFPETLAYRARVAECCIQLGIVARYEGRMRESEQNLRQGIALTEKIAKELPRNADLRAHIASGYRWLAKVVRGPGSSQEVERSLVRSLTVLDELVAEFPSNDWYSFERNEVRHAMAEHRFQNGQTEEGRRLYQRVVEDCEQKLANNAALVDNVAWLNDSAWLLVSRADGSPGPAQLAVKLAKRAVAKQPQGHIVSTLGTAYYRAGDWNSAIETLKEAEALAPQKRFGLNAIFTAMSYGRLGNRDEARRWYDLAVAWMDTNQPEDEGLRRFRAEAAELLGLKEKK